MEANNIFPDNWKELIKEKKVILYNTGVSSLLNGREKRIEKMKWVFNIFREHPEVVLWWRPHPLELSTVHSMLPELEEQYMEVRRQYVEDGIGILDESADLNRAIAVSDAYYGAWSSIVELYKATGKPVLHEDNNVKKREDTSFLPIALCVKDGFIWFLQLNSNKLLKVNMETYEVEKIINIHSEPAFKNRSYNYHIIDAGNSLLVLLGESNQIYEYEIETDKIIAHKPKTKDFIFHSEIVIEKNHKLLMLPYGSTDVLEFDYCKDTVYRRKISQEDIKASGCYEIIDTKIYMTGYENNILYCYDSFDNSCDAIAVGTEENQYWGVKRAGTYFVLPHLEKKAVTLWNEESGEITELTEFPEGYAYLEKNAYLNMFENNGDIYIFPLYANMILKVDTENKVIEPVFMKMFFDADYDINSVNFSGRTYLNAQKYHNYILAYELNKKCWQIFDFNTMDISESTVFEIENFAHKELLEHIMDSTICGESFCEEECSIICNLDNYINNLQNYNTENSDKNSRKNDVGHRIYKTLLDKT